MCTLPCLLRAGDTRCTMYDDTGHMPRIALSSGRGRGERMREREIGFGERTRTRRKRYGHRLGLLPIQSATLRTPGRCPVFLIAFILPRHS